MSSPRKIFISDQVFESLNKLLVNHDDTFSKVIERLLVDKEPQPLDIDLQLVVSESKVSPRQARAYSYTVMGHEHSVPASRNAQFEAYRNIIKLIAEYAGDQFCRDFAQSNLINKRCIAETKDDLRGNYSMASTKPRDIELNGKEFYICANCDEKTRIQFIIIACHLAGLKYGQDVTLISGWNNPGKYGHKQKDLAEQWGRDKGLLP